MNEWGDKQQELFALANSPHRIVGVVGPAQSGKTEVVVPTFCMDAMLNHDPTKNNLIVARTMNQFHGHIEPRFRRFAETLGLKYKYVRGSDDRHILMEHFTKQAQCRFNVTAAMNIGRAAGQQGNPLNRVCYDEFPKEDHFYEILQRSNKIFISANPEGPNHWFKTQYIDPLNDPFFDQHQYSEVPIGDDDFIYFPFSRYDNPVKPQEDYELMMRRLPHYLVERRVLGKWSGATGQVYTYWKSGHPPKGRPHAYFTGADFADANVSYAVMFGVWTVKGQQEIWAVDEYRHDGQEEGRLTPQQQAKRIWDWIGKRTQMFVAVDPGPYAFIGAMRDHPKGFQVVAAFKDIDFGVEQCQTSLANQELRIGYDCDHLISGLHRYSFKELPSGETTEKPDHVKCDEVDAMRYAMAHLATSEREGPVKLA